MRPGSVCSEEILVALREVRLFAVRLTGDIDQADELIQDTAERALRCLHQFEPGSNVQAWLRTIMRRRFIDIRRKRSAERQACARIVAEAANDPPAARIVEPGEEPPPEPMPTTDLRGHLRRAARALGEPLRTTFLLWMDEPGISYRELARRTGAPTATVGTRLMRARRSLRAMPTVAKRRTPAPPSLSRAGAASR